MQHLHLVGAPDDRDQRVATSATAHRRPQRQAGETHPPGRGDRRAPGHGGSDRRVAGRDGGHVLVVEHEDREVFGSLQNGARVATQ